MRGLFLLLGGIGTIIGKYGTIISLICWILGLLSVISPVSFWWVIGFAATCFVSIFIAAAAVHFK